MGQGDGWVRAFDAETGEMLWKFDINQKSVERPFLLFGKRNDLVAMPVFYNDRVYFAVGRHFEMCVGPGRLCCVDPTKRGDISAELDDGSVGGVRNPNSGLIWEYLGDPEQDERKMHRTLSSPVVQKGIVIAPDCRPGIIHCLDAETGAPYWTHNTESQISTSPLIADDKVYVCSDDGVFIFDLSRQKKVVARQEERLHIEASPVFANGVLYLTTRQELFAIGE